jgi:hypothetical protein
VLTEEGLILCAVFLGLGLLARGIWEQWSQASSRISERRPDDRSPGINRG